MGKDGKDSDLSREGVYQQNCASKYIDAGNGGGPQEPDPALENALGDSTEDWVVGADDSREIGQVIPGSRSSRKSLRNESNNSPVKYDDVTSFEKPENKVLKSIFVYLLFN